MADEMGKFDVPALGNSPPGIPNRRQFVLLGASAAAGLTFPLLPLLEGHVRPIHPTSHAGR